MVNLRTTVNFIYEAAAAALCFGGAQEVGLRD